MSNAPQPPPEARLAHRPVMSVALPQKAASAEPAASGFNIKDALFAIFKHKKLIIACTLLGLAGALLCYFFYPPVYESSAKLLVRYVVERSAVDSVDSNSTNSRNSEIAISSEAEIITSWDLAVQVADAIGPKRLLPNAAGTVTKEEAAVTISQGLTVGSPKGSNIIFVSYRNRDPQLATLVLDELIKQYFIKHLEVHRSAGAFDFVTQQIDRVKARLSQTEDSLIPLKAKMGIVSLADSKAALSAEETRTEGQLHDTEAELAEQQARVTEIEQSATGNVGATPATASSSPAKAQTSSSAAPSAVVAPSSETSTGPVSRASDSDLQKYETLVARLDVLRKAEVSLLTRYTSQNSQVRQTHDQLADVQRQKQELEKKFPDLPSRLPATASGETRGLDLATERARLAGLKAKTDSLKQLLEDVRNRIKSLSEVSPQLSELERQKELEESNYKYFEGTLEKARVDEALDPSKIPNISAVQKASPPVQVTTTRNKIVLGLAGGGLALGVALALLRGLILDRTLKRPLEVEQVLETSLLVSVPFVTNKEMAIVPRSAPPGAAGARLAPWDPGHFIRPYCEAIRDRIGLYFELHNLTHKPKLVGVAGFSPGAGTSTLAAGLAAALSNTGEGKVLLVDVTLGPEDVHPFFKGRPAYTLKNAILSQSSLDPASENLYLAKVESNAGPAQIGLKKFFEMIPNLKASDFDYIIFDMPYLEQTSPAWGMAAFMDKLLVIIEAESSHRTMISRGYRKLVAERNNVSVIFNKARSYVPKLLDGEFHH